jgi:uncharacterized membrane protein YdfJ with MMPL/SSD domain
MSESEQEPAEPASILPAAEEITPPGEEKKPDQIPYIPIPSESRFRRFTRRLVRWTIAMLIAFLIGLVVMAIPLYNTQKSLKQAKNDLETAKTTAANDLKAANKAAADCKQTVGDQKDRITSLETDSVRISVLQALSEVRAAKLALINNDDVNVLIFLNKASLALKELPESFVKSQEAIITKITQKLTQAQDKAKGDLKLTKTDLDKLLTDLIENLRNLEALLIPSP